MTKVFVWNCKLLNYSRKYDYPTVGIIAETIEEARQTFIKNYDNIIYWPGSYTTRPERAELIQYINNNQPDYIRNNPKIFMATSLFG